MREPETPSDQTTVAEQALDVLGRRIGGNVEILRVSAKPPTRYAAKPASCSRYNTRSAPLEMFLRDTPCWSRAMMRSWAELEVDSFIASFWRRFAALAPSS
jgi:hypothetical protein